MQNNNNERMDQYGPMEKRERGLPVRELLQTAEELPMRMILEYGTEVTERTLLGKGSLELDITEKGVVYVNDTGTIIVPDRVHPEDAFWAMYGFPGRELMSLERQGGLLPLEVSPVRGGDDKHTQALSTEAAYRTMYPSSKKASANPPDEENPMEPEEWPGEEYPRWESSAADRTRVAVSTDYAVEMADKGIPGGAKTDWVFQAKIVEPRDNAFPKWESMATALLRGQPTCADALNTLLASENLSIRISGNSERAFLEDLIGRPGTPLDRVGFMPEVVSPDLLIVRDEYVARNPNSKKGDLIVVVREEEEGKEKWHAKRFHRDRTKGEDVDRWIESIDKRGAAVDKLLDSLR